MRRFFPMLVAVVGLVALFLDILPGQANPVTGNPIETKLGLDLQGGLRVVYQAESAGGRSPTPADMAVIRDIMERRVNATGVSEPIVQTQGTDRVVVELPGVSDPESVRKLVGRTGRLDFVPLPTDKYGTGSQPGPKAVPGPGQPIDPQLPPLFSGDQIDPSGVNPVFSSQNLAPGERAVAFLLKSDGAKKFADYTTNHVDDFFAIVLDGNVVSAPRIREPITDGSGQITGTFTTTELTNLVTVLRYGALPFPVREIENQNIDATLGFDFLKKSLVAGAIGISLVFIFMLVYYRLPGAVAVFALTYYALVVLAIFRVIPVTLTLAGVAAFVLSVGMAVDANILIFERMKEELRAGKTLYAAVEAGFNRAWNSIFDSNVSSLITASILFFMGSSVIRGFALVLIIGVLTSMFTAVSLSRTVLRFVVRRRFAWRHQLFGVGADEFLAVPPAAGRPREARLRA